jgi:hypothetical protein
MASVVSMMSYRNIAQQFFVPVDLQLKMHSWAMWLELKINRRANFHYSGVLKYVEIMENV